MNSWESKEIACMDATIPPFGSNHRFGGSRGPRIDNQNTPTTASLLVKVFMLFYMSSTGPLRPIF